MATSSIGRAVIIKDDETAKRLIAAMDYADEHPANIEPYTTEELANNAKEIVECLSRRRQLEK
ncbi:MAG: hypothetical protein LBN20_01845 [Endomicrobium sp.]|jgi:hypothetical protein|nr:hypothetical protein [Endomicrobium sp.]